MGEKVQYKLAIETYAHALLHSICLISWEEQGAGSKALTSAPEDGWDSPTTPFSASALHVRVCVCVFEKMRLKEWNSTHCLLKWGRVLGMRSK